MTRTRLILHEPTVKGIGVWLELIDTRSDFASKVYKILMPVFKGMIEK